MNKKPVLITRRLTKADKNSPLVLKLTAEERTKLRVKRKTMCGLDIIIQLPRKGPLIPGEILAGSEDTLQIIVEASIEKLLKVKAHSNVELMKATYHLGNRHVDLEVHSNEIYLSYDHVLEKLLIHRGLIVQRLERTFQPENGAYNHTLQIRK